jgi:hypothetical protein
MMMMAIGFTALSAILVREFYRKYRNRLGVETAAGLRYDRIADYFCRPIPLAFEYRCGETGTASLVEADVEEIFHYGRDYFLKARSSGGKHSRIYQWNRIANLRIRSVGRPLDSLEQLFLEAEGRSIQVAA